MDLLRKKHIADIEPKTLFAFWRYDSTFLGGEIVQIREDGIVLTKEYSDRMFKPALILPYAEGVERLAMLRDAQEKTRLGIQGLNRSLTHVSHSILGLTPPKET